jgi:hypothetical protein
MSSINDIKIKIIEKIIQINDESILKRIFDSITSMFKFRIQRVPLLQQTDDLIDLSIPL